MSDYTPTTAKVRDSYAARHIPKGVRATEAKEEFDRWLAEHDAKVRAEEREKAAQIADDAPGTEATGYYSGGHQMGYQEAQSWIAARIREQGS